ncbi:MAG: hypothetical protein IKO36_00575 [Bacteroidaceae bacterium]|nr:hypothetical protein [Bacteroidaceae bacterium]
MRNNKRGTKDERSILAELKEKIGNEHMPYWILWKYAPELLPESYPTYDDLKKAYTALGNKKLTERDCDKFLYYQKVQDAVKWLLKKQRGARMIELYNCWYERAKSDSNALKEFLKLQEEFFKNDELSELENILRNSATSDDEEEYEMNI